MQTIYLHHPYPYKDIYQDSVVLALGFFDGVHRGHQKVLNTAHQIATKRDLPLAAMTFDVTPTVMYQQKHPKEVEYLTTLPAKQKLMAHFGVDILYVVQLTSKFSQLAPQKFVDQYIVGLQAEVVVAGYDYTYGRQDEANMQTIVEHAAGRFEVIEVPKLELGHEKVGSTQIKKWLNEGAVDQANEGLGFAYFFNGTVIHGEKRGRELGFPTANLTHDINVIVPKIGVYVVEFIVNHHVYWGVASIGHNITFGDNRKRTVEIYIMDYNDGEIYGEHVQVFWHKYLRPELKFNNVDELISQMKKDEVTSREYIESYKGTFFSQH